MIRLSDSEVVQLKDYLLSLGVKDKDLACAYIEGSMLYVKEPRDIDILCLTKKDPLIHKNGEDQILVIRGLPLDVTIFSVHQFERMDLYFPHQFYHEEQDYLPVLGDPKKVPLHRLTPKRMAQERKSFIDVLYKPASDDYQPKRLVTLFVLAKRLGHPISDDQIEAAHNGLLNPSDYVGLFNTLFTKSSPKVHHKK